MIALFRDAEEDSDRGEQRWSRVLVSVGHPFDLAGDAYHAAQAPGICSGAGQADPCNRR